MAAGETRNAAAIRAASMPRTVCSINGVRAAESIAGCAQTKRRFNRSSGKLSCAVATLCASSAICCRNGSDFSRTCLRRAASIMRLRATWSSHASGFRGTPSMGHRSSAARNASLNASSAPATSPERDATYAIRRPYELRAMDSIVACGCVPIIAEFTAFDSGNRSQPEDGPRSRHVPRQDDARPTPARHPDSERR